MQILLYQAGIRTSDRNRSTTSSADTTSTLFGNRRGRSCGIYSVATVALSPPVAKYKQQKEEVLSTSTCPSVIQIVERERKIIFSNRWKWFSRQLSSYLELYPHTTACTQQMYYLPPSQSHSCIKEMISNFIRIDGQQNMKKRVRRGAIVVPSGESGQGPIIAAKDSRLDANSLLGEQLWWVVIIYLR